MECALGIRSDCVGVCAYHDFAQMIAQKSLSAMPDVPLSEVRRMLHVYPPTMSHARVSLLRPCGSQATVAATDKSARTAPERIARFLRLLDHLGTVRWLCVVWVGFRLCTGFAGGFVGGFCTNRGFVDGRFRGPTSTSM
jgi:hypothetical protein